MTGGTPNEEDRGRCPLYFRSHHFPHLPRRQVEARTLAVPPMAAGPRSRPEWGLSRAEMTTLEPQASQASKESPFSCVVLRSTTLTLFRQFL